MNDDKDGSSQQAVWHNGGCNSAEHFVGTWTLVPRMTVSVPRHCAKPPPRFMQAGESVVESIVPKKRVYYECLNVSKNG